MLSKYLFYNKEKIYFLACVALVGFLAAFEINFSLIHLMEVFPLFINTKAVEYTVTFHFLQESLGIFLIQR